MPRESILIVEDDRDILELVEYNLAKEGYSVTGTTSAENAINEARSKIPGLILLDLMLPDMDGLEVCKIIKKDHKTAHIPIIMLTARGEESDIVAGLELGADDYITKPFNVRVLVARIRAVLRRRSNIVDNGSPINIDDLAIDLNRHDVRVKGKPVDLTATEFRLLHYLARRPGWVFTRYQIVEGIRGEDYVVTDRSVDVQIVGLRKKLGVYGNYIETVRGIGYRFKES
jgi:two-component system alkaline phosphatase synthesis response regulator PhoP